MYLTLKFNRTKSGQLIFVDKVIINLNSAREILLYLRNWYEKEKIVMH